MLTQTYQKLKLKLKPNLNEPKDIFFMPQKRMYTLRQSKKKTKKYDLITPENKIISFGAKGMSDYTLNRNPKRRDLYINRHEANEK